MRLALTQLPFPIPDVALRRFGTARDLSDHGADDVYLDPAIAASYLADREQGLVGGERAALAAVPDAVDGKRLLEIGIGAGRVAVALAPRAARYVGVDYSEAMLDVCRDIDGIELRQDDMRDLSDLPSGGFDLILGPFNVLDILGHGDRLLTLRGFRRLLPDGGLLLFSSHNRRFREDRRLRLRPDGRSPVRVAKDAARLLVASRSAIRRQEVETERYALVNDSGHNFRLLHYHVYREHQLDQLRRCRFEPVGAWAEDGRELGPDYAADVSAGPSIVYLARAVP